ncbi:hypothetical protein Q3G72_010446 [Acer saccharum]|nr:hypothetical protein Q3G72_010446 [Acer saccharum]
MKEAVKVAKMVDEMHVYGWPISSKVAAYGWNGRRSTNVSRQNGENLAKKGRGDRTIKEGNRGDLKGENTGFRSFVKVVTGHRSKFKDTEKELMKSPTANLKSLPNMERHEITVDPPTLPNHMLRRGLLVNHNRVKHKGGLVLGSRLDLCSSDKDKAAWSPKIKVRPSFSSYRNAKLVLDKVRVEPCFEESESSDFSSDFLQENGPFFKPKNLQGECSKISNQHNSGLLHSKYGGLHSLPEIQLVVQLDGSQGESENCGEALERSSRPINLF